jgi:tRNA pseudouridine65 synthase
MLLKVLYQDQDYIAIHKPSGLLVHRTSLDRAEKDAVVQILRDQLNRKIFPIHRLDRPTSGVLILAFSSEAAQRLAEEFKERRVKKNYLAVVRGFFKESLFLDHPLVPELKKKLKCSSQEAQTYFDPLDSVELPFQVDRYSTSRYSLISARPITGRTHQIRRHLKHLNHPIVGDVNHGNGKHNLFLSEKFEIRRMLLACTEISFQHPEKKKLIQIKSAVCEEFLMALQKLGLRYDFK